MSQNTLINQTQEIEMEQRRSNRNQTTSMRSYPIAIDISPRRQFGQFRENEEPKPVEKDD
eukprot:TRINITY_DN4861_c0_g1_i1.p1 TRINITY_DN4861_c0_g1~~TRINITY_DN4861_c0_g1_i1.p1  ORF type:complete len:67 (-),score=16.55 TRINITY_DN4861_c0_g1_i1:151-330(-)